MNSAHAPFLEGAALLSLDAEETCLRVTGREAEDYLQRMVSCDLRRATESAEGGRSVVGTLMTGKGRLVAPFRLVREEGRAGFLLIVERAAHDALREALERLVILEDVSFEDPGLQLLSVQGPAADACLRGESAGGEALPTEEGAWVPLELAPGRGLVLRTRRSRAGGWDLLLPAAVAEKVAGALQAAGATPADEATIEAHRILAGIPRFGRDATGENLPPEVGLDAAIAYDKGCYAGQEVVARIRTYGHVNRRLCLCSAPIAPAPGGELRDPEGEPEARPIGAVTSSAVTPRGGGAFLASIRYRHAVPGAALLLAGGERGIVERVLGGDETEEGQSEEGQHKEGSSPGAAGGSGG